MLLLFFFFFGSLCLFHYPRQPHTGVYHIRIVCMATSFALAIGVEHSRYALYLADISLRVFTSRFYLFCFMFFFIPFVFFFFLFRQLGAFVREKSRAGKYLFGALRHLHANTFGWIFVDGSSKVSNEYESLEK